MNQQQQQNLLFQQTLAQIDALNPPPAVAIVLKNAVAQAHITNSMAFHFVEQNQHQRLSPLTRIGTTFNVNFSNLNQMLNLGVPQITNLGELYTPNPVVGPFHTGLLRLTQGAGVIHTTKEALPQNLQARGLDNAISQISATRGIVACFGENCNGSNTQCIWVTFELDEEQVYGAMIACRVHVPSLTPAGTLLQIPAGTEIYVL